jgi:hypothetical protein
MGGGKNDEKRVSLLCDRCYAGWRECGARRVVVAKGRPGG